MEKSLSIAPIGFQSQANNDSIKTCNSTDDSSSLDCPAQTLTIEMNQSATVTEGTTNSLGVNHRLPRNEYRKLKKKLRKKAIRQEMFSLSEQEVEETPQQKEARISEEQENDRQRLLWELREKQFERKREEELKREKIKSVSEKISKEIASRTFISENSFPRNSQIAKPSDSTNTQISLDTNPDNDMEKESVKCPFYQKTGACRYGNLCSREHPYPTHSKTILIKNMYVKIPQLVVDEESDNTLEFDEAEARKHFENFFEDVHTELLKFGRIQQLKICKNELPHLDGNVYVQYSTSSEASLAKEALDGRWYAGKQLACELVPIENWKTAICGLHQRLRCPKGKDCNFLHVYRNPGNLYHENDQSLESITSLTKIDADETNHAKSIKENETQQSRSPDRRHQDSRSTRRSRSPRSSRSRRRSSSRSRSPSRRRSRKSSPDRHRSSRHPSRSSRYKSSSRRTKSRSRDRHRSSK